MAEEGFVHCGRSQGHGFWVEPELDLNPLPLQCAMLLCGVHSAHLTQQPSEGPGAIITGFYHSVGLVTTWRCLLSLLESDFLIPNIALFQRNYLMGILGK